MATLSSFTSKIFCPSQPPLHVAFPKSLQPSVVRFTDALDRRNMRSVSIITRAGPSSTQYIFAFVFPLSLLAITVFTALRIGDSLDQKFLEELAMNKAIREAEEAYEDDAEVVIPKTEEPALPKARNRPKREV